MPGGPASPCGAFEEQQGEEEPQTEGNGKDDANDDDERT